MIGNGAADFGQPAEHALTVSRHDSATVPNRHSPRTVDWNRRGVKQG